MTINYRIYSNRGSGGAVDYTTPIATTSGLSAVVGPLSHSSDNTFVVRAFDTITGLEEANTTARVRLLIGADGSDVSALPGSPHAVTINAIASGGCRVTWAYVPFDQVGTPTGFNIYLGTDSESGQVQPVGTVRYQAGTVGYSIFLDGPYNAATYLVKVAAYNETGEGVSASVSKALPGPPTAGFEVDDLQIQML